MQILFFSAYLQVQRLANAERSIMGFMAELRHLIKPSDQVHRGNVCLCTIVFIHFLRKRASAVATSKATASMRPRC